MQQKKLRKHLLDSHGMNGPACMTEKSALFEVAILIM